MFNIHLLQFSNDFLDWNRSSNIRLLLETLLQTAFWLPYARRIYDAEVIPKAFSKKILTPFKSKLCYNKLTYSRCHARISNKEKTAKKSEFRPFHTLIELIDILQHKNTCLLCTFRQIFLYFNATNICAKWIIWYLDVANC